MADDSLARRAREAYERFHAIAADVDNATDEYRQIVDELEAKLEDVTDPATIEEVLRTQHRQVQEHKKVVDAMMAELRRARNEIHMIEVEAKVEGTKLRFEAVKQQATYSIAAVAGVAAVTTGVLPEQLRAIWLFWVVVVILLGTLIISLLLLYLESYRIQYVFQTGRDASEDTSREWVIEVLYLSVLGLPAAIVAFLVFVVLNL